MNNYCCQFKSQKGEIFESYHDEFFVAMQNAINELNNISFKEIKIFDHSDMNNPICAFRTIK